MEKLSEKMKGLVLEGGGAKGSYHIGAIKALYENGYTFDGVTGTSIGAINAALVAQGDIELCYELWSQALTSKIIDVDDAEVDNLLKMQIKLSTVRYFFNLIAKALREKGISTKQIERLMQEYIDEDKIRASSMDFGLVTVSLSDYFRPLELFKEEIPSGMMHDYILASAYYPAFQGKKIGGKRYIDGGLYDNLPINPLIRRGYKEIIAVRTKRSMSIIKKPIDNTVKIDYIQPSESLGGTLVFSNERIMKNINLGYYDALRFIHNYLGWSYYIEYQDNEHFSNCALTLDENLYKEISKIMKWEYTSAQETLQKLMDYLKKRTKRKVKDCNYYDILIMLLEAVAGYYKIERFKVYTFKEFVKTIKSEFDADATNQLCVGRYLSTGLARSDFYNLLKVVLQYF